MTTTQSTLAALDLDTAARATSGQPRKGRWTPPAKKVEEVEAAAALICQKYVTKDGSQPLLGKEEELVEFCLQSRANAKTIVEMGWAMAEAEKRSGAGRDWFFNQWMPGMKARATEGTPMPEDTRIGAFTRLGRTGRDLFLKALMPIFGAKSDEARKKAEGAIIGKYGSGLYTSKKILEMLHGEERIGKWWEAVQEADKKAQAENAAEEEVAEESDTGTESEDSAASA